MSVNAKQRLRHRRTRQLMLAEPVPTDDVAIEVWAALAGASHNGLSLFEMQRALPHLSGSQLRRGIDRINHVLQQTREQPLIVVAIRGRSQVYKLPERARDYQEFAIRRLHELLTRAGTEVARAEAAMLRWPSDIAPYVPKLLHRLREDIEDLVADIVESTETES